MFEELKNLLVTRLGVEPEVIQPTTTLQDTDLDSLAIVEICMFLENDLNISISDSEIFGMNNIGDLAGLMEQRSANV
ncbi:acyl carrier protein [Streptomyces sp. NPDC002513]